MNDKDIRPLIDAFFIPYNVEIKTLTFHQKIFGDVMNKVYDLVEYRKAMNLARIQNESNSMITYELQKLESTTKE